MIDTEFCSPAEPGDQDDSEDCNNTHSINNPQINKLQVRKSLRGREVKVKTIFSVPERLRVVQK